MEQYREKIEHYGGVMENMGLTPVAARVFVYLLLSPENRTTFEDLVNYFKVSKSAISNALKMLANAGMVESRTVGGQRRRYFSVNFEIMFSIKNMTSRFTIVSHMLDDIRSTRNVNDSFSNELENASMFYKMLLVELPIVFERWKRTIELNKKSA